MSFDRDVLTNLGFLLDEHARHRLNIDPEPIIKAAIAEIRRLRTESDALNGDIDQLNDEVRDLTLEIERINNTNTKELYSDRAVLWSNTFQSELQRVGFERVKVARHHADLALRHFDEVFLGKEKS